MKKKLALLEEAPCAEGIHSAVGAYVDLPWEPAPSVGSPGVNSGELGCERSGEASSDKVPKVVLDLGTERTCWDRLWVDSGPLGKMDLERSPSAVDTIVGSLVHGLIVEGILLDSSPDPYPSHSSRCVRSVRIHVADDLAVGQVRADLVSWPVAYVAIFTSEIGFTGVGECMSNSRCLRPLQNPRSSIHSLAREDWTAAVHRSQPAEG